MDAASIVSSSRSRGVLQQRDVAGHQLVAKGVGRLEVEEACLLAAGQFQWAMVGSVGRMVPSRRRRMVRHSDFTVSPGGEERIEAIRQRRVAQPFDARGDPPVQLIDGPGGAPRWSGASARAPRSPATPS